jgi:hypothetical protein
MFVDLAFMGRCLCTWTASCIQAPAFGSTAIGGMHRPGCLFSWPGLLASTACIYGVKRRSMGFGIPPASAPWYLL